jgi:hypothetical protein
MSDIFESWYYRDIHNEYARKGDSMNKPKKPLAHSRCNNRDCAICETGRGTQKQSGDKG